MSLRVAREFVGQSGGWECFFATTYTFELELFDAYLFRRLGDAPVNATVLCDFHRLTRRLADIAPEDARLMQRANRDYLLRGIHFGGAFHPKTYFFGGRKRGVLLVGSGNLSLRGIEQGREVFSRFESTRPDQLATIRAWRDWVDQLVQRSGDTTLRHRWLDLLKRTEAWLPGASGPSAFVSNLSTAVIDQLESHVKGSVEELHVLAPFYDRDARALAELIKRFTPRELHIYLGAGTSVHGPSLASLVKKKASGLSEIHAYQPSEFVHAKLIGVITREGSWLLTGSANLSQAALTASLESSPWANVEAGIIIEAPAGAVRAAFVPPETGLRSVSVGEASKLEFRDDEQPLGLPLRLFSARPGSDGCVVASFDGATDLPLFLTTGLEPAPLDKGKTTIPLARPEGGTLVWIVSSDGSSLSNGVLLDDPALLRNWLEERSSGSDRPSGLEGSDVSSPLVQFLLWLNDQCIFDIDDTRAGANARRLVSEEDSAAPGDWSFLEELARDELRLDPRVDRYRHAGSGLGLEDEVYLLLHLMLDKTPAHNQLRLTRGSLSADSDANAKPGVPWSPDKKVEVRVFNVLSRWCGALADPRFIWIERTAPVRNYAALLGALARCWEEAFLPTPKILALLQTLFEGFIRSERAPGYLGTLDDDDRKAALDRLPDEARAVGAALCYAVLREQADWGASVFTFQPFLVTGLELDVFSVNDSVPDLVKRLVGEVVEASTIDARLRWAATYLDDPHWCRKQEQDLNIPHVGLTHDGFNHRFGITLAVDGSSLDDPRLVSLARQALAYRRVEGAVIDVGTARISVHLGDPVFALVKGADEELTTRDSVDAQRLAELEQRGIGFGAVLQPAA